jgi:hypothetical protein
VFKSAGEIEGKSVSARSRKVGAALAPATGPANTVPAGSPANSISIVPALVIGDPDTVNTGEAVTATEVTVPAPDEELSATQLLASADVVLAYMIPELTSAYIAPTLATTWPLGLPEPQIIPRSEYETGP